MLRKWNFGLLAVSVMLFSSSAFAQGSCETDYNGDGITDVEDVKIFQAALGTQEGDEGFLEAADLDEDGAVTAADYAIFLGCN